MKAIRYSLLLRHRRHIRNSIRSSAQNDGGMQPVTVGGRGMGGRKRLQQYASACNRRFLRSASARSRCCLARMAACCRVSAIVGGGGVCDGGGASLEESAFAWGIPAGLRVGGSEICTSYHKLDAVLPEASHGGRSPGGTFVVAAPLLELRPRPLAPCMASVSLPPLTACGMPCETASPVRLLLPGGFEPAPASAGGGDSRQSGGGADAGGVGRPGD